jgi:hypothetical protein
MGKRADYSVSWRAEQDACRVSHAGYSDGVRAVRTPDAGAMQREPDRRPARQERAPGDPQGGLAEVAAVGAPSNGQSGAIAAFFLPMIGPAYRSRSCAMVSTQIFTESAGLGGVEVLGREEERPRALGDPLKGRVSGHRSRSGYTCSSSTRAGSSPAVFAASPAVDEARSRARRCVLVRVTGGGQSPRLAMKWTRLTISGSVRGWVAVVMVPSRSEAVLALKPRRRRRR